MKKEKKTTATITFDPPFWVVCPDTIDLHFKKIVTKAEKIKKIKVNVESHWYMPSDWIRGTKELKEEK